VNRRRLSPEELRLIKPSTQNSVQNKGIKERFATTYKKTSNLSPNHRHTIDSLHVNVNKELIHIVAWTPKHLIHVPHLA